MHTLRQIFNRQKIALFFLLALFVIGWAFSDFRPFFGGLILGSLFGLYNFWILVRRMERFDQNISKEKETKLIGGTALRFGSGVAAAAIALSNPEKFDLIGTVVGLMIPYVLLLVDRIVVHVKHF